MFAKLLSHPGVIEDVELRSRFGFMAFHGGSLERMTDQIARAAADDVGASFYAVLQPREFRWHVPSARVDPAESPALASFLDHVDVAVAMHGFGRAGFFTSCLLGGSNRELATHIGAILKRDLGHYKILDDLDEIPKTLRGVHPDNPVNRTRSGGVQIELPPRIRGMGPFWSGWSQDGLTPHTRALIAALAEAAATWKP